MPGQLGWLYLGWVWNTKAREVWGIGGGTLWDTFQILVVFDMYCVICVSTCPLKSSQLRHFLAWVQTNNLRYVLNFVWYKRMIQAIKEICAMCILYPIMIRLILCRTCTHVYQPARSPPSTTWALPTWWCVATRMPSGPLPTSSSMSSAPSRCSRTVLPFMIRSTVLSLCIYIFFLVYIYM